MKWCSFTIPLLALWCSPALAQDEGSLSEEDQKLLEEAESEGEVIEITATVTAGSDFTLDTESLERFERDDIHHILSAVPGVYVREEDGYGLRPNIGMRGSGSERSAKIALMEDGIPVAPAPYSAPAAYYFPLTTRIQRIDVLKGPSAILHGPNTVGGSVDLVSRSVPTADETTLDIAGGTNFYGKLHASHAEVGKNWGLLVEVAKLRASGFKELDGGGDTGFDKNDAQVKVLWHSPSTNSVFHKLQLTAGFSNEVSNETYTGLSEGDFAENGFRRYVGTQLDKLRWNHQRAVLSHTFETGRLTIKNQVYGHRFSRSWRRLNGFDSDRSLSEVLANPTGGVNAVLYSVLLGESDSQSPSEALLIATNDRKFYALGVQTEANWDHSVFSMPSVLKAGLRLHADSVDRDHREDVFNVLDAQLVADDEAAVRINRDALGTAMALAAFAREEVSLGPLRLSAGLRTEVIRTQWRDDQNNARDSEDTDAVLIPGAGAHIQITPWLGALAGVYKGFVPGAPSPSGTALAEKSINYEAGARVTTQRFQAEAIGFFNNYSNLKGSCTFSSGCMEDQIDEEFAGGSAHVFGLEASVNSTLFSSAYFRMKGRGTYTFTKSEFRSSFRSDNPQWGIVRIGDELPYLPRHLLSAEINFDSPQGDWRAGVSGRFNGAMRDSAGQGVSGDAFEIVPSYTTLDLSGGYDFGKWGNAYVTVNNLLNTTYTVSFRPFGARPGAPLRAIIGYKNTF